MNTNGSNPDISDLVPQREVLDRDFPDADVLVIASNPRPLVFTVDVLVTKKKHRRLVCRLTCWNVERQNQVIAQLRKLYGPPGVV